MHCTWFNEKKKFISPIYFCGLFPPLLTRPPICCPHTTNWERSAPHPPGGRRWAPPAPAQLACSFRPRPGRSARGAIVFDGRRARGGEGAPFGSLLALTLFSQSN